MIHLCSEHQPRPSGARITGVGKAEIPEQFSVSNQRMIDELLTDPRGTSDAWIQKNTGIERRYISPPGVPTSYWGDMAAQAALKNAGIEGSDLDLIIIATVSPDHGFPTNASIIQYYRQAYHAEVVDLSAACASFGAAMHAAYNAIMAGAARKVLILGNDNMSVLNNWNVRDASILFGDHAAAFVMEASNHNYLRYFDNGGLATAETLPLIVKLAGGSREPIISLEQIEQGRDKVHMDGNLVFKQVVPLVPKLIQIALEQTGLSVSDIDLFAFHQANLRMIEAIAKRLGIPPEKIYNNIHNYGNTTSASIPLVVVEAYQQGRLKKGDLVMLAAFGAGFVWSIIIFEWGLEGPAIHSAQT